MGELDEKTIINILHKYNVEPEKTWQDQVLQLLYGLDEKDVTESLNVRKYRCNLFYFFKMPIMKKSVKILLAAGTILLVLVGAGGGVVYASDSAVSGDLLFPLDKALENVQRSLISDPVKSLELEVEIMDERILELETIEEEGEDYIDEAVNEVEEQQERVNEEVQHMEKAHAEGQVDEAVFNRIMEQVRTQTEEHLQKMEQVRTRLEEKGNDNASEAIENSIQKQEETRQRVEETLRKEGDGEGEGEGETERNREEEQNRNEGENEEDQDGEENPSSQGPGSNGNR